jgi:hypothetical protein
VISNANCEHDNLEEVAEGVQWCPDCGSQFSVTREDIARVKDLFYKKLEARYPNHPWIALYKAQQQPPEA